MRMIKSILKILVVQIIIAIFSLNSYALDKPTHEAINEYIAKHTIQDFSLDEYLKTRLGFQKGSEEIFDDHPDVGPGKNKYPEVWGWLSYGGKKEDEPFLLRSVRHFHDPLKSWDKAGLKGIWDSSILWGQRTDQWPGGHYSWQDVRDYFYSALKVGRWFQNDLRDKKSVQYGSGQNVFIRLMRFHEI